MMSTYLHDKYLVIQNVTPVIQTFQSNFSGGLIFFQGEELGK